MPIISIRCLINHSATLLRYQTDYSAVSSSCSSASEACHYYFFSVYIYYGRFNRVFQSCCFHERVGTIFSLSYDHIIHRSREFLRVEPMVPIDFRRIVQRTNPTKNLEISGVPRSPYIRQPVLYAS